MSRRRNNFRELLQIRAPEGFISMLVAAANEDCTTVSEWVRRACLEKLRATAALRPTEAANDNVAASEIRMSA